jgi:hypothetical protein
MIFTYNYPPRFHEFFHYLIREFGAKIKKPSFIIKKMRAFKILIENYTTPCASIASATLTNPAMFAPFT